jgi:DNA-binding transcriptional LysR family regulator
MASIGKTDGRDAGRGAVSHDELELRHLRVFLAVIDAGGYTRAASALGLSQSTVSENLAALERTIGARLLRREGRRTVTTAAGDVLAGFARQLVTLAVEAAGKTAAAAQHDKTPLLIGAAESIGAYLLPPALATLRAAWPETRTEVRTGVCADIRAWVQCGDVELGLVIEPAKAREKQGSILARTPLVLCARPGPVSTKAHELARRPFHLSDQAGAYHQAVRGCFRSAGAPTPALHSSGSIEGVKRAVLSSADAVGVLPAFAIAHELGRGELEVLRIAPALPILELKAVLAGGEQARPRRLVLDLLDRLRALPVAEPAARPVRASGRGKGS